MKRNIILTLLLVTSLVIAYSQVGIGTTTPNNNAILELKSSTKGLLFPRTSTSSRLAMSPVRGLFTYDTTANQVYYHNGTSWLQITTGTIPTTYWNPVGNNIYNNNTGNIGIGVNAPPYKLSVDNDIFLTGNEPTLQISGPAGADFARIKFLLTDEPTDYTIVQGLSNLWISRQTGAFGFVNDLVVSDNGYIGVGESNPQVRLSVSGGTDVGGAYGGFIQTGVTAGTNIGIDNNEIQARIDSAASTLFLNNNGGSIQIGSGAPAAGYSLCVNGKTICEELKIQDYTNWPDYVFSENYPLRSLDALRGYIQTHRHLPNIPSATEVEMNGIMVGDMQKKLMEKIEELTLYILQLEEKYDALHDQLDKIQTERN